MPFFNWDEFPNSITLEGRRDIEAAHQAHLNRLVEKDLAKFQGPPRVIPPVALTTKDFVSTSAELVKQLRTEIDRHNQITASLAQDNINSLQKQITELRAEIALLRGSISGQGYD